VSEQKINIGAHVMFENEQAVLLGIVTEAKKDKFVVLNDRARLVELTAPRLHLLPSKILPPAQTKEQQVAYLNELRKEAEDKAMQIDIAELWSVAKESAREWPEHELAELLLGQVTLIPYIALRIRLLNDKIYFKRDKNGFIPRTEAIINELKHAEELRLEKKALEVETVEFITRRLNGEKTEIPAKLKTIIDLLAECAAGSERIDHAKQRDVKEILSLFTERTKIDLHGGIEERALELLQRIGHFHKNTNLVLYRYNPRREFPIDTLNEAEQLLVPKSLDQLPKEYQSICQDFTNVKAITIDDISTKDMDDALSIEQTEYGYRLSVHISNVALLVQENSALERESVLRATSIYSPDLTINMLPEVLSEQKLSLVANEIRPALSCIFELDHRFTILKETMTPTLIKVVDRLSYEDVDKLLAEDDHDMTLLYNIASQKEQQRIESGAVKVQKGDAIIHIEADGKLKLVEIDEQSPARSLVSEMMVLANSCMARYAANKGAALIFRGQPQPDRNNHIDPRIPEGPARAYALRSQLKKSTTSFSPVAHASLGLKAYAQATSPIRRFADILNQRQLLNLIIHNKPHYSVSDLEAWVTRLEEPLNKATQVSRDSKRFWLLRYLEDTYLSKSELSGTIIRTDLKNPIVELDSTYLTLPVKSFRNVRPGDQVKIRMLSVKPHEDRARLEVIQ
jgi:exoribonuclease II